MKKVLLLACCALLAFAAGCGKNGAEGGAKSGLTIAVIPKGTTHEYWKSIKAGAEKAGQDLGVNIIWHGPLKENDRAQQISIVEQFISQGVSGIVLAPLDDVALQRPVQDAKAKKIPVVIIDSALQGTPGKDFVSFCATDNTKGGELGGEYLAKLLNYKGKVVLLRYEVGSASTEDRENGFLSVMKKYPGIQIISDNQYAGATEGEAKNKAMAMIDILKQADGIFCPNESSTLGMLLALKQNNLIGKVKFVGFDASPPLVDAMKAGEINALVAQDPIKMGYTGVKTLVDYIRGKKVPATIDTGVKVLDMSNINTPAAQKMIYGNSAM